MATTGTTDTKTRRADTWRRPSAEMPKRDIPIEWTNSAGDRVCGRFIGVWIMDDGMYIYYTPTRWRYTEAAK